MGKGDSSSEDDFSMSGEDSSDFDLNEPVVKKSKAKATPAPKKSSQPKSPVKTKTAAKPKAKSKAKDTFVVDDDDDLDESDSAPKSKTKSTTKSAAKPKVTPSSPTKTIVRKPVSGDVNLNFGSSSHLQPPRRVGLSRNAVPPPLFK